MNDLSFMRIGHLRTDRTRFITDHVRHTTRVGHDGNGAPAIQHQFPERVDGQLPEAIRGFHRGNPEDQETGWLTVISGVRECP